ncbi:acyl-CoA dehydrogenase family protein, partial [Amycolatopsis sp. NPDC000740]|uniref:acyl-CoA dehydrogenase family protein n=1 Tax=Amycolatopsis sp. NPDC000740 TaxID=3154269 RepID=UPI00331F4CF0
MIRESVRAFIEKEIRPHLDELEHGDLPPYDIMRKLFSQFGIDAMAGEAVDKMLAKQQAQADRVAAGEPAPEKPGKKAGANPLAAQGSMAAVVGRGLTR